MRLNFFSKLTNNKASLGPLSIARGQKSFKIKDDIIRWVEGQLLFFLSDLVQKSAVKFSIESKTPSLR